MFHAASRITSAVRNLVTRLSAWLGSARHPNTDPAISRRIAELAVGQSWTYCDAPNEDSRVVIGRIDELLGVGTVISVSITRLPATDTGPDPADSFDIFHAPFTAEALARCLLQHVGSGATSDGFEEGYRNWQDMVQAGETGVFTVSAAKLIRLYGRVRR